MRVTQELQSVESESVCTDKVLLALFEIDSKAKGVLEALQKRPGDIEKALESILCENQTTVPQKAIIKERSSKPATSVLPIVGILCAFGLRDHLINEIIDECLEHPEKIKKLLAALQRTNNATPKESEHIDKEKKFASLCNDAMQEVGLNINDFNGLFLKSADTNFGDTIKSLFTS